MTLEQLYLEAARVAELEKQYHGIHPIKYRGNLYNVASLISGFINWMPYISEIEFALAIVEGMPVFKGDALWSLPNNFKFIADHTNDLGIWNKGLNGLSNGARFTDCSWNPPKPRTVMVELTVEDAEWLKLREGKYEYKTMNVIAKACRKALEGLKS